MKKRFAALLLAFSLILSLAQVPAFAAETCMKLNKTKAVSGETVTLTYTAPQEVTGVGAVSLKIGFDKDKLSVEKITAATVTGATTMQAKEENSNSNGEFSMTLNGVGGETFTLPGGTVLLTVTMKVKDGVNGAAAFQVKEISISDAIGDEMENIGVDSTGAALEIVTEITGEQAIAITAPVKNGTPQNTIAAGTGYTGAIAWEGNPTTFAANTAYTANVTLTANQYYRFAQTATAKVDGAVISEARVAEDGSTLTFKATFPKTEDKVLSSISITEQPTKTSYQYGDTLDVAGMVVTGTYDDTSTAPVTGYTVEYANGDYFKVNDTSVTVKKGEGVSATLSGLTVGPKAVTVKADDKSKTYGEDNPSPLTFTVPDGALVGSDTKDDLGVSLTCAATAASPAGTPVDITGTASSANYTVTVTPGSLTVNKATITNVTSTATDKSLLASDTTNNADLDALTSYMALPTEAAVTYGDSKTENLPVTWTADKTFQQKGAVYTFTGKVTEGTNFNSTDKTASAKLTVTPVKITDIGGVPATLTLSKAEVKAGGATLTGLGLPGTVKLTYDNGVTAEQVSAAFDKDLTAVQAAADQVTSSEDKTVELTLTTDHFPAWATLDTTLPKTAITITYKYVIPESAINFADISTVYGTDYTPAATVTPDGNKYDGATISYTYAKNGVAVSKPTDAGTYTVTATAENSEYKGSKTVNLVIEPKTISGAAVTLPENYAPVYDKTAHEPAVTVKDGQAELVLNKDYTVGYANNVSAGNATVTVTGIGNYKDGVSPVTFAITKADLSAMKPLLTGTAQADQTLTAVLEGVDADEITWTWTVGNQSVGATGASYAVKKTDSNQLITVKATAVGGKNYTGTTLDSDEKRVAKFTVTGWISIKLEKAETNDNPNHVYVIEPSDTLVAVVNVIPAGIDLEYQWYVNDAAVEGDTGSTYQVGEDAQIVKVTADPGENYNGLLTSIQLEVGKKILTGTVDLTLEDGIITAAITGAPEDEGAYDIVWLRDGTVIPNQTGKTYTTTAADKGHSITVKLVAKGEDYTGEVVGTAPMEVPVTAPGAPTVTAEAGDAQATVTWTAPADNGGVPITGYQVWVGKEAPVSLAPNVTSHTFTGLTNDTEYTFRVAAVNEVGTGAAGEAKATPKVATVTPPEPSVPPVDDSDSGSSTQTPPKAEITTPAGSGKVDVKIPATKDKDGGYTATISDSDAKKLVAAVDKAGGGNVEITPAVNDTADKVTVALPVTAVSGIADSKAENTVIKTPIADVVLGKDALEDLSKTAKTTVGVTAEKKNNMVRVSLTSDGKELESVAGEFTARIPVDRTAGQGLVAILVEKDGTEKLLRTSVVVSGKMVLGLSGSASVKIEDRSVRFEDVHTGYWAKDGVDFTSARDLFRGVDADNALFAPEREMTRSMLAAVLFRLDGERSGNVFAAFTDVADGQWYTQAVAWAAESGVVEGCGDGTFAPERNITREQLCVMLCRYAAGKGLDMTADGSLTDGFADGADVSDWAARSVNWAIATGLVRGQDGNRLAPQATATRAEVAVILQRFVELMAK